METYTWSSCRRRAVSSPSEGTDVGHLLDLLRAHTDAVIRRHELETGDTALPETRKDTFILAQVLGHTPEGARQGLPLLGSYYYQLRTDIDFLSKEETHT